MRSKSLLPSLFAIALIVQALPAYADDAIQTLPTRKAGIWELKTTMDEGNGPRDQTIKMCIDAEMEKNTVAASIAEHKSSCETYKIGVSGGTTTVEGDCQFNKRKVVSTTTMTGDFKTTFDIKIESRTSDPKDNTQTIVVKRTITQSGKYLGESCGDLKSGEAEGPDGKKVMVQ
jgi:Protein of unknown function (DUF3617)